MFILFLDFAKSQESEVPDPYYGQGRGFEIVLDLIEDASSGLLGHIKRSISIKTNNLVNRENETSNGLTTHFNVM